jgi:hypothetical protein
MDEAPTDQTNPPGKDSGNFARKLRGGLPIAASAVVLVVVAATIAYGLPEPVLVALAESTGLRVLLPQATLDTVHVPSSKWTQSAEAIPTAAREALPDDVTGLRRLRALRLRPPLAVESTALSATAGGRPGSIVTPSLTLRDATIFTNGAPLTIEVETLDSRNGVLRAFPPEAAAERGPGRGGGTIRLVIHGAITGTLAVDLTGEAGAAGLAGATGAVGPAGDRGATARPTADGCAAPAGRGADGARGAAGGAGQDGAAGGNGGMLEILADDPAAVATHVTFVSAGGPGGTAGMGGKGGPGGPGGIGGGPAGLCFGDGAGGRAGPAGPAGLPGLPGRAGTGGSLQLRQAGR